MMEVNMEYIINMNEKVLSLHDRLQLEMHRELLNTDRFNIVFEASTRLQYCASVDEVNDLEKYVFENGSAWIMYALSQRMLKYEAA